MVCVMLLGLHRTLNFGSFSCTYWETHVSYVLFVRLFTTHGEELEVLRRHSSSLFTVVPVCVPLVETSSS